MNTIMKKALAINGGKPVRTKLFPAYLTIGEEEKEAVTRVLDSGILSRYLGVWGDDFYGGPEVQAFEKEWAAYFGVKHAIAVNSATTGLQAALGAVGVSAGDEVIVSPYTMSASAVAPLWYGATPVFADIEQDYLCLDPRSVEERITKKTKAVVVVDLFGQPYDRDALRAIAKKHRLTIVEDAAQAPGAKHKGAYAGTLGDIGVFSLNYHKHIHTGEGGVVVTDNDALAERIRLIRNHAESVVEKKGVADLVNMVGSNFRMTEIGATIGRAQLLKLEGLNEKRIHNANYLARHLVVPGISFAPARPGSTHVYYQQALFYDEKKVGVSRDVFIRAVKAELPETALREGHGPLIGGGYVKPLYLLPLFQKRAFLGGQTLSERRYERGLCPVAEDMHMKVLITHEFMHSFMKKRDLDDVIAAFEKVYKHRSELTP